ncbi:hypothetical protein E2C01_066585 [Portunus trituberculatus]|uniref:Uncharacterized protein n=1 Tax=Portunus trituberculatus TaxID=210409 RepID=A0A5B7HQW4_PORTR|nr:hypothetical protein [Portunus trituberculatus]
MTFHTIRCLSSSHLALYFSHILRVSLQPDVARHPLQPSAGILISTVCCSLRRDNINVPMVEVDCGPPWKLSGPEILFTPISQSELPFLQRQLALESITDVSS